MNPAPAPAEIQICLEEVCLNAMIPDPDPRVNLYNPKTKPGEVPWNGSFCLDQWQTLKTEIFL